MPGASEILIGLARTADRGFLLAVAWHVAVAAVLMAALAGWRPDRRRAALLLTVPLWSVSALAWLDDNPFNALVFAALALALAVLALRAPREPITTRGPAWARAAGAALVAFAWLYPHFLDGLSPIVYVAAAPMGIIPCPTLALVAGLSLCADSPGGRGASWVVAGAALFYGAIGVLQLGVWIDLALVAGAVVLAIAAGARRAAYAPRS